jgi:hypothetical protein
VGRLLLIFQPYFLTRSRYHPAIDCQYFTNPINMQYPDILGRHIRLMPEVTRSAEWFATLPPSIQKRFYLIVERFCPEVAAEYLRDNHGQVINDDPHDSMSNDEISGVVYSNRIELHFPDGVWHIRPRDWKNWRFVGCVDTPEKRIIRTSKDAERLGIRLSRERLQLINGGVTVSDVTEPKVFPLRLQVAEDVGLRQVVGC